MAKQLKVIRVLLSKIQKAYLERNVQKLMDMKNTKEEDPAFYNDCVNLLLKLDNEIDNLITLNSKETVIIVSLLRSSCSVLTHRTIPEYDKRGDVKYKKKAEKTLKELDNLLRKIDRKVK